MVTVIHSSKSLRNALNYNEQKSKQHKANCLMAVNYPKDVEDLNFHQKLHRLTRQAALNQRTKVNSVHISVNFDPSERLSKETLKEIATTYMDKIGFGKQPFLVYEHKDAGHPHLHIVTTNIKANGKRIELHNLGRNQSEKARKAIEKEFGLVKADSKKLEQAIHPVNSQKVQYGKSDTKRAITNVLDTVLAKYKYTSLPELNAVLKLYNVAADRGSEQSRTYQRQGLVYRVLDEHGNKVGAPIKAGLIYNKPTLKYLQSRFEANEVARQPCKQRVKSGIDWYFLKTKQPSLQGLMSHLKKDNISTVLRQNKEGLVYGTTFVDHKTQCVFNGSDLGKGYTAKGIQERCQSDVDQKPPLPEQKQRMPAQQPTTEPNSTREVAKELGHNTSETSSDRTLPTSDRLAALPFELQNNLKKKKKRKRLSL